MSFLFENVSHKKIQEVNPDNLPSPYCHHVLITQRSLRNLRLWRAPPFIFI